MIKALVFWAALVLPAAALAASSLAGAAPARPKLAKLVLAVVIDQFRADYLTRFESRFLPARRKNGAIGGFKYLMDQGAYYPLGEYQMLQCETGPGHATVLSGSYPYQSGIALNVWFDAAENRVVYCVNDTGSAVIGTTKADPAKGISPKNFRGTTLGDEIKNAGFPGKVVAISLKDRAAVLMGGKRADLALWFDTDEFKWVSSRYYFPNGELPPWVNILNSELALERSKGGEVVWKRTPEQSGLSSSDRVPVEGGIERDFPHRAKYGNRNTLEMPFGAEVTEEAAERAIDRMKLGQGKGPDVLALSFSEHDFLGHHFGPNSIELEELTVAEDRVLAKLFGYLDKRVGLKNVTIAFTGDHGIQIHPEQAKLWKYDAGRINQKETQAAVEKVLDEKFGKPGQGTWIALVNDLNFWISPDALRDRKASKPEVEARLKEALLGIEGAAYVFTEAEVAARKLPPGLLEKEILNQTFPGRSGDVVIIPKPYWAHKDSWYELGHVTGYNYDRRVPIALAGPGIKPGRYAQEAQVIDIAPTLSYLLGILPPALSHGRVLAEAIK